jgi:hypothetical protein
VPPAAALPPSAKRLPSNGLIDRVDVSSIITLALLAFELEWIGLNMAYPSYAGVMEIMRRPTLGLISRCFAAIARDRRNLFRACQLFRLGQRIIRRAGAATQLGYISHSMPLNQRQAKLAKASGKG